jgi:hypothetical protein
MALLFLSFSPLIGKASAATSASWVDKNTISVGPISVNGKVLLAQTTAYVNCALSSCSSLGSKYYIPANFTLATNSFDCGQPNALQVGKSVVTYTGGNTASFVAITTPVAKPVPPPGRGTINVCTESVSLTLGTQPTTLPSLTGAFVDSGTIQLSDNHTYKDSNTTDSTRQYTLDGGKDAAPDCVDLIKDLSSDNTTGTLYSGQASSSSCKYTAAATLTLDASKSTTITQGSGAKSNSVDCGGAVLNWFMCPVITGAMQAATWIEDFNINMLTVDVGPIFDKTNVTNSSSQAYYVAWNSFRVIAIAILIIAGLVMVISQALGFELLDAYTIRKVLPRLLIAIIGISLSWPLMRLATGFFDTLGFDVRNLMYAPFSHLGGSFDWTDNLLASIAVGGTVLALGFASLTFILTLALALFVSFLVLVLRQIAIVMLIIVAPVAIACSVLPNTNRVWRLWFENFLGLMLMFPIYSAIVAAAHIFAAVALSQS